MQFVVHLHRVNVASNEQGADKPLNSIFVDTALNASYSYGGNVERCLYFDTGLANTAVGTALAGTGIDVDMRIGMVNDAKYGGCGGQWAVLAGANGAAPEIALHEVGHSFGRLIDGVSQGLGGETIDIISLGLSFGSHTIEASAYDSILDHSFSGGTLDWCRYADESELRQSVLRNITVSVPEPGSAALIGWCLLAAGIRRRRAAGTAQSGFHDLENNRGRSKHKSE